METFGGKESTRIPKEESKTLRSQTLPKRNLHAQPHMGRMTQRLPLKKNETCGLPPKKDPKAQLQTSMGCIIIWKGYTTYMEMKDETKGQSEFSPTSFSLYILQLFWALFLCHLYMPAIPLSLSLNLPKALRPSHQSSSLSSNGSYGRASLPTGVPSLGYQDPRFGFDGTRSLIPLADMFSDGQSKHVANVGLSSPISHANNFPSGRNQNFCPVPQLMHARPASGLGKDFGFMYPNDMAKTPIHFGILGCANIARKVSRAITLAPNDKLYVVDSR